MRANLRRYIGLLFVVMPLQGKYHDFVIVIPSYNNERWCEQNLNSALNQNYPTDHYRIIYINDCSTDQTLLKVQAIMTASAKGGLVTLVNNAERKGALHNFYHTIHQLCLPHEIIINLDGDDWLDSCEVLDYLNRIYASPDVWLTYGRYRYYPYDHPFKPGTTAYSRQTISANLFRQDRFRASHLRTYYAWLFQKIRLADLQDADGKFFSMCPDLAIMYPMLEMCGERHRCLDRVLCVYNDTNPLNENKVNFNLISKITDEIKHKPKYSKLTGNLSEYIGDKNKGL